MRSGLQKKITCEDAVRSFKAYFMGEGGNGLIISVEKHEVQNVGGDVPLAYVVP